MEPDAAPVRQSIASLCKLCMQSFKQLGELLGSSGYKFADQLSQATLEEELGRFRVWVGNSGVHQSGRISLDHRLLVHTKFAQLLWDLKKALDEGNDMQFVTKDICSRYVAFGIIVNGGELEPPNTQQPDSDTASSSGSSPSSLDGLPGDSDDGRRRRIPRPSDASSSFGQA